jgi:hypothetical protein
MNTNTNHTMTPNTPTKKEIKAARRKLKQVHKLLGEICVITSQDELEISYSISRAAPRPPVPPSPPCSMTPAEFREMDLSCRADRLICATLLDLAEWPPDEVLTYATVGSGDNEVFTSLPRLLSTMMKPKKS